MCGILGIASAAFSRNDRDAFAQMLQVGSLRGHHSTGMYSVVNNDTEIFKRALNSQDFLDLRRTQDLIEDPKSTVLVGHNRWATTGDIDHDNAHPFKYGHITMVHNGSLTTQSTLPEWTKFEVDSENIAYAFYKDGAEATIPKLEGAFSLVWYDSEEQTLNFVRNDQRPMWFADLDTDDIVFASEHAMLSWVCGRNSLKVCRVWQSEVGKIYTFDMSDKVTAEYSTKDVYVDPGWANYYGNGYGYSRQSRRPAMGNNALARLGIQVGDEVRFECTKWEQTAGLHGKMNGLTSTGTPVEVYQVPMNQAVVGDWYTADVTYGSSRNGVDTICGARLKKIPMLDNHKWGDEDDDDMEFAERVALDLVRETLIKKGCAYCNESFTDADRDVMRWVNDKPMHDICHALDQEDWEGLK